MEAFALISEDIMHSSKDRKGKPCWYTTNDLGSKALNDALLMERGTYQILKKIHGDKPYYLKCVKLINSVS